MTVEERGFDESAQKSTKSAKFSIGFEITFRVPDAVDAGKNDEF